MGLKPFLILSVLLFTQYCGLLEARPAAEKNESGSSENMSEIFDAIKELKKPKGSNQTTNDSSEEFLSDRTELMLVTVLRLVAVASYSIKDGVELFDKVVKDPELLAKKDDPAIGEHLKNMTNFVDKVQTFVKTDNENDLENLFNLMEEFGNIIGKYEYNATETYSPNNATGTIAQFLKNNGANEFETAFTERFDKFTEHFSKAFDNYVNSLTEESKTKEKDLINWYNEFKQLTDVEKKVDSLEKFFTILAE